MWVVFVLLCKKEDHTKERPDSSFGVKRRTFFFLCVRKDEKEKEGQNREEEEEEERERPRRRSREEEETLECCLYKRCCCFVVLFILHLKYIFLKLYYQILLSLMSINTILLLLFAL